MASNNEKAALFPLLFADLMMGAAAIIIMSLIFLKIVSDKGIGEFEAADIIALPPGLLDREARPVVRIRVLECARSVSRSAVSLNLGGEVEPHATGASSGCSLTHYKFDQGLNKRTIVLKGAEDIGRRSLRITIFVGAYQISPIYLPDINIGQDQLIGTISLNDPKNIWRQS